MEIEIKPTYILVVIGKRGSGKTWVIRYLVRECDFTGTIVYDGNLSTVEEDYNKERDFGDSDHVTIVKRRFTDPAWDSWDNPDQLKGKHCVIDEFDMVNMNHRDFYKEWINTGRHWPSGGIVAARRPTMLPRDVTANADLTILFRAKETSVQKFIKESYTDEISDEAAALKKYEFLIVDASQDLMCKAILSKNGKRLVVLHDYTGETPEDEAALRNDSSEDRKPQGPPPKPERGGSSHKPPVSQDAA